MSWRVVQADCIEAMAAMEESSVDAVVCDPPYGIRFMGQAWDGADIEAAALARAGQVQPSHKDGSARANPRVSRAEAAGKYDLSLTANEAFQAWCKAWATEALRVLKPGGHMLVFGGTRTYHRLACGIEDAGFEIRDCLAWMFGSGFPKSLDVSKAIEVHARLLTRHWFAAAHGTRAADFARALIETDLAPMAEAQESHDGEGTALKPAHEPIVVARKPLSGTVAANVLEHGTGGLNIDGCRIGVNGGCAGETTSGDASNAYGDGLNGPTATPRQPGLGRWPANVVLDEGAAAVLDEQTGELQSGGGPLKRNADKFRNSYGAFAGTDEQDVLYGDSGGPSRFFYCAKASRAERNAGLDGFDAKPLNWSAGEQSPGTFQSEGTDRTAVNSHPTVKPIALMRWLVRLVAPPGGLVLDPFTGSGTTGCAAVLEGFDFLGIEREAEYVAIAEARIGHVETCREDFLAPAPKPVEQLAGQLGFDDEAAA